jgi:hypothetical protein
MGDCVAPSDAVGEPKRSREVPAARCGALEVFAHPLTQSPRRRVEVGIVRFSKQSGSLRVGRSTGMSAGLAALIIRSI